MRKPRAIIYDDNADVANVLKDHFTLRGYDVLTYHEPARCPVYVSRAACSETACADIVIVDFHLPAMNGLELLRAQSLRGCRVPAGNRALMVGALPDATLHGLKELGCRYVQKPFAWSEFAVWLDAREALIDLSQPLAALRKGRRIDCSEEVECSLVGYDKPVKGIAVNRGPEGLCLKLAIPVRTDQEVTLRRGPSHAPRAAVVRWVAEEDEGSYMVGLKYA